MLRTKNTHDHGFLLFSIYDFYLFESLTKLNHIYQINFIGKKNMKFRFFQSVRKC